MKVVQIQGDEKELSFGLDRNLDAAVRLNSFVAECIAAPDPKLLRSLHSGYFEDLFDRTVGAEHLA